ncbi:MAG: hypothetical protein NTY02_20170 [Acidobacteria bacterium]|nr:hypothetical protein [Acidobacteriota bacterium]
MTRGAGLALCGMGIGLSALALTATRPIAAAPSAQDFQSSAFSHPWTNESFWGVVHARVIATGIPGAGAVAEVGDFLTGSPMHDKPAFAAFAQPGSVLDPHRVLVASTSNFGAPPARPGEPEGTVLSIDPRANAAAVPPGFAAGGGQASALTGVVQMYTAQSPAFLNGVTEPQAVTRDLPSASLPLGISINNGNGRPWIANAPNGANGDGTITVLDPQGYPLAGAPDPVAGGVFAGNLTNRNAGSIHGLTSAALGTAIVTKSPDLSGRAVFVAVKADGSVVQINVAKGVDELAPPGTVTPMAIVDRYTAESTQPRMVAREGLVFNWVPSFNRGISTCRSIWRRPRARWPRRVSPATRHWAAVRTCMCSTAATTRSSA